MRFVSSSVLSISLAAGFASNFAHALPGNHLEPRRGASILNSPAAQPALPAPAAAAAAASSNGLDLDNIQGDILVGMKKKNELFYFFSINKPSTFKRILKKVIHPFITTTTQLLDVSKQPQTALNVAFSHTGFVQLGVNDTLGDTAFPGGQFADAAALGDPGTSNWVPAFAGTSIHGVFLLASDSEVNLQIELALLKGILGSSASQKYILKGNVRPGSEQGHEHFGFMDGISQPAVTGFVANPTPGQAIVNPGVILVGENGDTVTTRPDWAKDGSFLAFRQLKQLVPEFEGFLTANPLNVSGLTPEQGSALLGARMVGRWKSGAPVDLAPLFDDPVLAADPQRNNNFTFAFSDEDILSNQTRCPFSAHVRKTAPRADFNPVNAANHIIRAGIPYGPEVTPEEQSSGVSSPTKERGLAFVSYQSNLNTGFRFIQTKWANNPRFIFGKTDSTPGADPIIGALAGAPRNVSGLDPIDSNRDVTLVTDFVQSRGGEYFFSPSLSAIADIFGS